MAALNDLLIRLEALKKARSNGLRSVEYSGQRVEYKSDSEIAAAITAVEKDIADAQGTLIVRGFYPVSRKAL